MTFGIVRCSPPLTLVAPFPGPANDLFDLGITRSRRDKLPGRITGGRSGRRATALIAIASSWVALRTATTSAWGSATVGNMLFRFVTFVRPVVWGATVVAGSLVFRRTGGAERVLN